MKPERLVYSQGGGDDVQPVQFHVTVTFEDQGGKTKLIMRALFPSAAERDRVAESMAPSRAQNKLWNVSPSIWRRWINRQFTCPNQREET